MSILRKSGGRDKAVLPVNTGPVEPLGLGPPSDMDTPSPPPFGPMSPSPYGPPPVGYGPPGPPHSPPYGPPHGHPHGPPPAHMDRTMERMQRDMERMRVQMEYQMRMGMPPPAPHTNGPTHPFGPLSPRPDTPDQSLLPWEPQPSPSGPVLPWGPDPAPASKPASWVAPVIRNSDNGHRVMELELDVTGFGPDDIHINTDGHVLEIHARQLRMRRDPKGAAHGASRICNEFKKQFTLPEPVRAENLRCLVSTDGRLVIEGPLGPHVIPHKHRRKVKFALSR